MKEEIKIFFTALMFYTRIPCPKNIDHSPEYINKATRYFPLIGSIVGFISFVVFWLSSFVFSTIISVLFSIVAGVLVTGAFHEDGLADVFDGFGGGWTKAKILDIMKDSRIGAYGVIALLFSFAIKLLALAELLSYNGTINSTVIALFFITYHSLSRLTTINIVFTAAYSRDDEVSKAKPIAQAHSLTEIVGAYVFGLLPLMGLCCYQWKFCLVLLPLFGLYFYAKRYFIKWIDGYTGDCLGAVEQLSECVCLLTFVAIWKYI